MSDWMFQHTATRRWLLGVLCFYGAFSSVSTHSHPKVAAGHLSYLCDTTGVSTHSHPKVAAHRARSRHRYLLVSTHSHPKVAAQNLEPIMQAFKFQHTATRRWLPKTQDDVKGYLIVSTHSHPKVAARCGIG